MPRRRDAYDRLCLGEYGFAPETLDNIAMRSKIFAAKRIDGRGGEVAVVVYESTDANAVTEDQVRLVLEDFCGSYSDLLESFRDYVPTPEVAAERGF
jgi:hypothetical protein